MLEQDPETGKIIYDGNITFKDAMEIEPRVIYAKCVDAGHRPETHRGDWPTEGQMYPIRVVTNPLTKELKVAVLGFEGFYPYFNLFASHRFQHVSTIFLN